MSSLSIQAMRKMSGLCLFFFSLLSLFSTHVSSSQNQHPYQAKYLDGSSQLVDLEYHMGPVVTSPINLYTIWYGHWEPSSQAILRDFLFSLSSPSPSPSVADWWHTVSLYTDQTGSNITRSFTLAGEHYDSMYSHGMRLTRLAMQSIIKSATSAYSQPLPFDTHNGIYLVLTSSQVQVQDFCREVCGFHHFTFPSIVGATVPYAWIGHSGVQCPGMCAYPFALPDVGSSGNASGSGVMGVMGVPNGDPGTDGMVSVIGHELAEVASNPLINAWYAGGDPTAPTEIADLCVGVYGSGGGGGFVGSVNRSLNGEGYNLNGVRGRKFLVQWLWNPSRKSCFGPNAVN